jgi:hypothetical protein
MAYQTVGHGSLDVVLVLPWFSHLEAPWELPESAHLLNRLASFGRLLGIDIRAGLQTGEVARRG